MVKFGDVYFETSSTVDYQTDGDVTINLIYNACDYYDANTPIGSPALGPSIKISSKPTPFAPWTERLNNDPIAEPFRFCECTFPTIGGQELYIRIDFAIW